MSNWAPLSTEMIKSTLLAFWINVPFHFVHFPALYWAKFSKSWSWAFEILNAFSRLSISLEPHCTTFHSSSAYPNFVVFIYLFKIWMREYFNCKVPPRKLSPLLKHFVHTSLHKNECFTWGMGKMEKVAWPWIGRLQMMNIMLAMMVVMVR